MLRKVALGKKLICGFSGVAIIAAVVGIMGYWGVKRASETQNAINSLYLPSVNGLWMIKDGQDVIRRVELVMFLPQMTQNEIAGQKRNLGIAWAKAEKGWAIYAPLPKKGEEAALWEEFRKAWTAYKSEHDKVIALLDGSAADKREAYDIASYDARDKFRNAQVLLDKLLELNVSATDKAVRESDRQAKATVWAALIIAVTGVAASLALGILLSSIISRNLNLVVASLSENSDQVLSTARSLSSSAQVLADGAAAEAASLEETSSAMEEVSSMVSRNTENSARAKDLADRAGASVDRASASMSAMLVSMKEISSTSEVTGKIVKSIDGIAFQTNILALNAAVEAARAGEAGASFAVVADEVRTLAQRVAKEAQSTSELIDEAVRKIHDGTALMEKTHAEFREAAASVNSVTQLVGEISVASMEQARGIGEVGRAITQVDQVTQRTAANAEEIASSAEELSAWSGSLETTVSRILEMVRGSDPARARRPGETGAEETPEAITKTLSKTLSKTLAADHPRGAPATGRPCRQGMSA